MTIPLGTYEPPAVAITLASPVFAGDQSVEATILALEVTAGAAIGSCRIRFDKHYCDGTVALGTVATVSLGGTLVFRGVVVAAPKTVTEDDDEIELMLADDKFCLEELIVGQMGIGTQGGDGEYGYQDVEFDLVFNRKGVPNKDPTQLDFNAGSTAVAWTLKTMLQFIFAEYVRADVATLNASDLSANYDQALSHVDLMGKTALQAIDHIATLAGESWALRPATAASEFVPVKPASGTERTIRLFAPQAERGIVSANEYAPSAYSIRQDASEVKDTHQVVSGWTIKETTYSVLNGLLTRQTSFASKKFFAQYAVVVTKYYNNGLGLDLSVGSAPKPWLADLVTRVNAAASGYLTAAEIAADARLRLAKRAEPALWVSLTGALEDAKLVTGGYQVDRKAGTIALEKRLTVRKAGDSSGDDHLSIEDYVTSLGLWYTVATRLSSVYSSETTAADAFLANPRTQFVRRTDLVPELREANYLPDLAGDNNDMVTGAASEEAYIDVTTELSKVCAGLLQASPRKETAIDLTFGFLPTLWLGDRIKFAGRDIGATGDEVVRRIAYDLQDMGCEVSASDVAVSLDAEKAAWVEEEQ